MTEKRSRPSRSAASATSRGHDRNVRCCWKVECPYPGRTNAITRGGASSVWMIGSLSANSSRQVGARGSTGPAGHQADRTPRTQGRGRQRDAAPFLAPEPPLVSKAGVTSQDRAGRSVGPCSAYTRWQTDGQSRAIRYSETRPSVSSRTTSHSESIRMKPRSGPSQYTRSLIGG